VRVTSRLGQGETLALLGSAAPLGEWSLSAAVPLASTTESFPLFFTPRPVRLPPGEVAYKYAVLAADGSLSVRMQRGAASPRRCAHCRIS
jgi:hypothetical protein